MTDDISTREFCERCRRVSAVGFYAERWLDVAGYHWHNDILCIRCFAELGDEKHIVWEDGMEFFPVSYATHHAGRVSGDNPT